MKLLNIYGVGIGALLLGLTSTPAMAVTIDLFSDVEDSNGFQFVLDDTADNTPVFNTDTSLTGVIGGQRTIEVNKRSGILPGSRNTFIVNEAAKNVTFSSDTDVSSDFSIAWDGNYGPGGIDLTGGGTQNFFLLEVTSNDLGANLVFDVTDIDGGTSRISKSVGAGVTGDQFFSFASATGGGDLTKASSIKLSSTNTTASLDMRFAFVDTAAAVPFEFSPSMGILFFGGLFGVHRLKKRLKSC
ncbi:MAG: hypothetical protein ACFCU7_00875 [Pleurocapsa sp.]